MTPLQQAIEETPKERLIKIFMVNGPPYLLEYRRIGHGRKLWINDLPVLSEMMKEGTVKMVEETRTTRLYKYYRHQPTL